MLAGQLALVFVSIYLGCALYMVIVDQSARLTLGDQALFSEWRTSDQRAFPLFAILALAAAAAALLAYAARDDMRWMVGALCIMLTWPYWFVTITPMSARLLALGPTTKIRRVVRFYGLLGAGLSMLSAMTVVTFLWALN